jgi:hypothetical protein
MLALLLRTGPLPDMEYPWMHPRFSEFPQALRSSLAHAQRFAETMQGAALLYNLMLAEAGKRDSVDDFRDRLAEWSEELQSRGGDIAAWNVGEFWRLASSVANIHHHTKTFVSHWLELRTWENAGNARENKAARSLINLREQQLKGPRARLTNPRALELWGGDSGTARLNYRWPTAHRLLADIVSAPGARSASKVELVDHA